MWPISRVYTASQVACEWVGVVIMRGKLSDVTKQQQTPKKQNVPNGQTEIPTDQWIDQESGFKSRDSEQYK